MTRQNISTGATANDGTGDTLRSAGNKINDNFVELYQAFGTDSNNLGAGITFDSSQIIFSGATNTTTLTRQDPSTDVTINLGDSYFYYRCNNNKVKKARTFMVKERTRPVDYIAYKKVDEVIDDYPPDWESLAESEVIKKVTLIYDSLGWDLQNISMRGIQSHIEDWW